MEGKEFKDIIDKVKPLDLVFFDGIGIASDLIQLVESILLYKQNKEGIKPGEFSHVGMLVTSEILEYPGVEDNILYILESTISGYGQGNVKDISGKSFFGVQLRKFSEVVKEYEENNGTEICVGNLIGNPLLDKETDKEELKRKFSNIAKALLYTDYEYNLIGLGASLIEELRPFRDYTNKIMHTERNLFCSELVATILKKLNIINENVKVENVVPMDFLGFDKDKIEQGGIPRLVNLPLIYVVKK